MPPSNMARPALALAEGEPRDAFAGEQEHPSNNSHGDRAQDQRRDKSCGLNAGERQHLQTRERAESLAETIRAHWAGLGIEVDAFIIQIGTGEFAVRSSLKLTAVRT